MESYLQYLALRRQLKVDDTELNNGPTVGSTNPGTSNHDYTHPQSDSSTCGSVLPCPQRLNDQEHKDQVPSTGNIIVDFAGPSDPANPRNWSITKRVLLTLNLGSIALLAGFAGAIDSAVLKEAAKELRVGEITESLATGLFLIGIGSGALFFGPLSEVYGRNPVYMISMTIYMLFIMGAALSHSATAQLLCRFFAGFFSEAVLSTIGGSLSDVWTPLQRVAALPLFAAMGFSGPVIGPMVGGFVAESSSLSWRSVEWITLIISGALLVVLVLFQPETHGPTLLKWKAHHLRVLNKDSRFQGSVESERVPWYFQLKVAVQRPFEMFIQEPTIALWTLYLTFVYGVNFGFLSIYPVIFGGIYGQSDGNTGLIFLGLGVGFIIATVPTTPLVYNWTRSALEDKRKENPTMTDVKLAPESRLWYAMIGGPAIPISLFWMAWTASASINIWSPILASVLFGCGYISIYLSTYQYLIDVYESYAASALTINTLVRYIVSGVMVTAVIPICRSIGVSWTLTWLACVAVAFTPAPYLFYRFGPLIRSKSKYGS